ncbi:hypothetical protein PR002_g27112 [Phytophthora rubi]|uniref:Uncharacterized protein n=1 Tax=Phytophthora rubi TaxID=129364 RepID=A0A6A3HMA3_9STRA|nr:hypothetical protein PR002_g27112 [Phytophthora rubi]
MLELAPEDFMEPMMSPGRSVQGGQSKASGAYRLSPKKHHLVEAKAEAFLIKTIDDQHNELARNRCVLKQDTPAISTASFEAPARMIGVTLANSTNKR